MEVVDELCSFEGRLTGTDAERRAANRVAERLREQGRRVEVEPAYVHPQMPLVYAAHCLLGLVGSLIGVSSPEVGFALVLIAATPRRARTLLGALLAVAPVALVFVELLGPYDAATSQQPVLPELQNAALAAVGAAAAAALLCALWAIVERRGAHPRFDLPSRRTGQGINDRV